MDYQKEKVKFNKMSEKKQWEYIVRNREKITLDLDNDNTTFTFDAEDKSDDCTLFMCKADIGNRWGLNYLLPVIGVKAKHHFAQRHS